MLNKIIPNHFVLPLVLRCQGNGSLCPGCPISCQLSPMNGLQLSVCDKKI